MSAPPTERIGDASVNGSETTTEIMESQEYRGIKQSISMGVKVPSQVPECQANTGLQNIQPAAEANQPAAEANQPVAEVDQLAAEADQPAVIPQARAKRSADVMLLTEPVLNSQTSPESYTQQKKRRLSYEAALGVDDEVRSYMEDLKWMKEELRSKNNCREYQSSIGSRYQRILEPLDGDEDEGLWFMGFAKIQVLSDHMGSIPLRDVIYQLRGALQTFEFLDQQIKKREAHRLEE